MNSLKIVLLICAALLPAVVLCVYVFKKDRVEKEPIGLLLALFFLGAIICYPCAEIENVLILVLDKIFKPFTVEYEGQMYLQGYTYNIYCACKYFLCVALIEEGLKFIVLYFVTKDNKNFNSLFDGLIYAVFVSLGFAAFENIFYVLKNGWANAAIRALTAVPGHMFFAVIMGYFYSFWHMYDKACRQEAKLVAAHMIEKGYIDFPVKQNLLYAIFVPVLLHGLYDYYLSLSTITSLLLCLVFLIILYAVCFIRIKKMSISDQEDSEFVAKLITKKYPSLKEDYAQIIGDK